MTKTQNTMTAQACVAGAALALLVGSVPAAAQDFIAPSPMPALASASPDAASDGVSAQAGARITEYLGGGYMGFSEGCAASGWTGIQQIMVRAQPQGLPGNDADMTQVAIQFPTGTIAFKFDRNEYVSRTMYASNVIDEAVYVWNGPWSPEAPSMVINTYSRYGGSLFGGDEEIISFYAVLGNFNEIQGCGATMRVSLGRN